MIKPEKTRIPVGPAEIMTFCIGRRKTNPSTNDIADPNTAAINDFSIFLANSMVDLTLEYA
jgi:hypothetical protein